MPAPVFDLITFDKADNPYTSTGEGYIQKLTQLGENFSTVAAYMAEVELTVEGTAADLQQAVQDAMNANPTEAAMQVFLDHFLATTFAADVDYVTPTGNGSGLTGLNASNLASGTVDGARLGGAQTMTGNKTFSQIRVVGTAKLSGYFYAGLEDPTATERTNYDGNFHATAFYGDGSNLTGLGNVRRIPRSSNVELGLANKGDLIEITSGTFTQTFAPAATLGDGWFCWYVNTGAHVTLDPDGAETINGATTMTMGPGQVFLITCDGVSSFNSVRWEDKPTQFGNIRAFNSSSAFTTEISGAHRVTVVGGGGSGGAQIAGTTIVPGAASGGGAGGYAQKIFYALAGTSYTCTVAAGGTAAIATMGTAVNGAAGGTSSFSGFGASISCGGGAGGIARNTIGTALGVSGGTASGGDSNASGGGSGDALIDGAANISVAATGGGSVAVLGNGYTSGTASAIGTGAYSGAASGGAGVGGSSGTSTAAGLQTFAASGGGGAAAPSTGATDANSGGGAGFPWFDAALNCAGSGGNTTSIAAASGSGGAGSGGYASSSLQNSGISRIFGGSGGVAGIAGSGKSVGPAGFGGGSGGIAMKDTAGTGTATSGAGGPGIIIVEW